MHGVLAARPVTLSRLDLAYHPDMPPGLVHDLEQAARRYGLALRDLELLGQDPVTAQAFIRAQVEDDVEPLLAGVDWSRLEARLRDQRVLN